MPYEEEEAEISEEPSIEEGPSKSYTVEEMADYIAREATSGEDVLRVLSENGWQLEPSAEQASDEIALVEEGAEEEIDEGAEEGAEEGMLEGMLGGAAPEPSKMPGLDIVTLRMQAAKKALGKEGKKGAPSER